MSKSKMGLGQARKMKADFARDKSDSRSPAEKREVAKRKGSSKMSKT